MAVLVPAYTRFAAYLTGVVEGNQKFLDAVRSDFSIPNAHKSGPITVPVWIGDATSAVVDGVMLTNGANDTGVPLIYVDQAATLAVDGTGESTLSGADLLSFGRKQGGYMVKRCQSYLIDQMALGSPGDSNTIEIDNFGAGATVASIGVIDEGITYVDGVCQDRQNIYVAMPPVAYGKFRALVDHLSLHSFSVRADGVLMYQEVPILPVPVNVVDINGSSLAGAAVWGTTGTGDLAAIVAYRDAAGAAFAPSGAYLHGNGPIAASDGTTKLIWKYPFGVGLFEPDLMFHVLNP